MVLLAVAALWFSAVCDAATPKNLIDNSSFERLNEEGIPLGWSPGRNEKVMSMDAKSPYEGRKCLHLALDGKETMFGQLDYLKLTPGRKYTLSAYVKTKDLAPAGKLQILLINLGWSFGYQSRLPLQGESSNWRRYSKTFTIPDAGRFKYQGRDNIQYKVMIYAKGVTGDVWIDAIQLEEAPAATEYLPKEGKTSLMGDPIADALLAGAKRAGFRKLKYFQVEDPLFGELLSDEPGPGRILYYGYEDLLVDEEYRPYAKKFGHRYVLSEQVKELRSRPWVPMTNAWPRGGVGSYPTMRMILRPDNSAGAPPMIGKNPWIMHPGWLDAYVRTAIKLARQSLDESPGNTWGNTWGLWAGDEVFESSGIKVVPKAKRDEAVRAIDKEVRERFGFGKYGMPDSEEDPDPFKRIAFRRWVNAELTELYAKTYPLVKKINPKLVMLGPDPCGGVPPVDLEAMTPYFDLVSSQTWQGRQGFVDLVVTGADTKAMADLSECPVWSLVQHAGVDDPESIREQYSQVFRNGGEGIILLGVEWYDRELEHPKFINSAKWRAMVEVAETVTRMNKVKLPKPDTAMLYASDTYLTWPAPKMANDEHPQVYAAYAALGPMTGSWFSFVSDRQIDRGTRNLNDYKVLYIPLATYQRGAVLDKIEEYVKGGGVVVCTDPTAFTWDINGEDLSSRWERITGVRRGKARTGATTARTAAVDFLRGAKQAVLEFPGPGREITPISPSVKPLAVFADGALAATIRAWGKGQVICFASDPFASRDRNTAMAELVRSIQLAAGARVGQDIWRFKLPPFKNVHTQKPEKHRCLTNNHVELDFGLVKREPTSSYNLATGGTYTYDRFPNGIADAKTAGEIPFDQGHLTNRVKAFAERAGGGRRNPPSLEKWIVSWTDKGSVCLTVDLKKAYALARLRIVYSGILPAATIEGGIDGRAWKPLGNLPAQAAGEDVKDVVAPLEGKYRYVRVRLAARETDAAMELCELEIWGDDK